MTTPTHQPKGAPLQNLVPSSSFLQQLLEEINGSGTPTVLRERLISQGPPCPNASSNGSRRASSVWIGGGPIAQEACEQLRAADEARLRGTTVVAHDGSPDVLRPTVALHTLCFDSASSSSDRSSASLSPRESHRTGADYTATARATSNGIHSAPHLRCTAGVLRVPDSDTFDPQLPLYNGLDRTESPLIFCDIDSDISATPSPAEAPTSVLSAGLTDATSISGGRPRSPSTSGSFSPEKRVRSPDMSQSLSKKMRTMTLPVVRGEQIAQPEARFSWRHSISSDNRSLVRGSTFTERSPAMLEHMGWSRAHAGPEVSSFRPEVAGPQGVPPISITPVRPSTCKLSAIERSPTPELDDTPIYARTLHLVETDVSVYKKIHGDEWRDNSLCLYCFRQHGDFSKLTLRGYEVCGRNEALESHY